MKLAALDRKLIRELSRLKGQIATIALVIAGGITSFVALRGTYASLEASRQAYYDQYRFAHVFARVKRAPESLVPRIEALPGVALVQTRVAEELTLPIEGMARPAYGRLLSLPTSGEPTTNALCLVKGRAPRRGPEDEVVVLKAFADAHQFQPGQRIPAVLGGKLRWLRVVGIALSPEFVYAIRPGAMVDDPTRYAVLWMDRTTLSSAFQIEGAFNDVSLRLQPDASEVAVRAGLDRLLAPYGNDGAHGRKEQVSNRILNDELGQLATLSAMVPLVFLGVAAFLVNLVLGRLIRLQRHELATLKALGYTNREIGWHYLALVVVMIVPGMALGVVGGWTFGQVVMSAYANVFRFPDLPFRMSARTLATALVVSGLSAALGAYLAVRSAVQLPPAEAMRPPAPAHYRRSVLERSGLASLLGPTWMMVVREVMRRPLRTLLSSLGIAGAVALLVLGRFGFDSISHYFEAIFRREQRQDLSVQFVSPVDPRAVGELQRWPGVLAAEGLRVVPIRARFEQRARDSLLFGMPDDPTLRRLVTRFGGVQSLPRDGVVITQTLGEVLGLRVGERIDLELLDGNRRRVRPVVEALLDEASGLQVYGTKELVAELAGDEGAVSSVLLRVDPPELDDVERRLRRSPHVIDVGDVANDIQRLREMNASFIDIWTVVSIILAASVIFGVNYNNARIALSARSRDLASLRVLGYSQREVARVLIGGLAIEVGLAVPLGLFLGRIWAEQFMRASLDPETFRWSVTVAPLTYLLAASVALLSATASALWVGRSLNDLDLIGVLKTRE